MKLHHLSIMIIIVSVVVLGMITFINDLGDSYGTTADLSGLNKTQARLNEQQALSQNLSNSINNMELNSLGDLFVIPYEMIKVGWYVAKSIFGSWATVGTMADELADGISENGIPLPAYLVGSLISIFVITLVAIVVYGFWKWKFED